MTRSDHRSGPSRATVFALLAAGLTLLAASPASAKKKSRPPADSSDSAAAGPTTRSRRPLPTMPSPRRRRTTRRSRTAVLDTSQEAPKTDSLGHVHFASPNGEGLGRVVVNAPATEKVKVFLEGRLFGTAPVTIYSVPKGDYIVEAQYPNGKAGQQAGHRLGERRDGRRPRRRQDRQDRRRGRQRQRLQLRRDDAGRKNLMYGFLAGAVVGVALGTTFGILDIQAENDYQNTPTGSQAKLDDIQQRGQRDANIADVGWVLTAVGLVGAGICAMPLIFGGSEKAPAAPSGTPQAFMFTPVASPAMTGGAFSMRF